jgi:NagD protein
MRSRARYLSQLPRLRLIRHVALDMDGTIYQGRTLFTSTVPFLELLTQVGLGYTFLTNNSSQGRSQYLQKLKDMGVPAGGDQLFTSGDATIEYLRRSMPRAKRLFVLGTAGLQSEFREAGFELAQDSADDAPDAVVVGFDTGLAYPRLCRAAYWIKMGKPFIATHPDRVCPTDDRTVLVDCGAICAGLREAAGRGPDAVLGKPDPGMLSGILRRNGLRPEHLAMVGDRLYTDIEMAHRAGVLGVLVLTGEATAAEASAYDPAPDLVCTCLREFGEFLKEARNHKEAK